MKVTLDIQSVLPAGMGHDLHPVLADLLGPEFRIVGERIIDIVEMELEPAIECLRKVLSNTLVTGVQATFEEIWE